MGYTLLSRALLFFLTNVLIREGVKHSSNNCRSDGQGVPTGNETSEGLP